MKSMTRSLIVISVLSGFLLGCGGEREIKTYRVAKEEKRSLPTASEEDSHAGHNHGDEMQAPAMPQVHWELPAGWKEGKPGQMRRHHLRSTPGTVEWPKWC